MAELFSDDFDAQETIHFIEEKLSIGFWRWNLQTDAMAWSQGVHHLLGLRMGSVQPHFAVLADMIHPDDRCLTKTGLTRSDARFAKDDKFRLILKNGRVRWIKCRSEVLARANGGVKQAVGVMQDITELQEELIKLRLDSERLDALGALLATPMWTADGKTGDLVDIHNWKRLGENAPAFLGDHWIEFVHPDDRGETRKAWQEARSHNAEYQVEHRLRGDDGAYRWKRSKAVPIKTFNGNGPEYVGITVDIHNAKTTPRIDGRRITGAQIRAARGILRWSVRDLADRTKISAATIRRLEENDKTIHDDVAPRIFQTLSAAGVEFFATAPGKVGVGPR